MDKSIERRLIELAFDPFDKTGVGATLDQVHRKAVREGIPVQFFDAQQFFLRHVGAVSTNLPITLSMAELVGIPEAQQLLKDFVSVVLLCVKRLMESSDDYPKMTSDDLRDGLRLDELTIRKIGVLWPYEPFVQQGGSSSEGQWQFIIGRDIGFFKAIKNINDYLAVVDRLRHPVGAKPGPPPEPPKEPPEEPKRTEFKRSFW